MNAHLYFHVELEDYSKLILYEWPEHAEVRKKYGLLDEFLRHNFNQRSALFHATDLYSYCCWIEKINAQLTNGYLPRKLSNLTILIIFLCFLAINSADFTLYIHIYHFFRCKITWSTQVFAHNKHSSDLRFLSVVLAVGYARAETHASMDIWLATNERLEMCNLGHNPQNAIQPWHGNVYVFRWR